MTRLILVRHGQSLSNELHVWGGQSNSPLTALGEKQAKAVAAAICATEKVDAIYTSDLDRAYQTGLTIAKGFGLPVTEKCPALREINTGRWTGSLIEGTESQEPELVEKRKKDIAHFTFPEGESYRDLYERGRRAILSIVKKHEGECVLIAAHGGLLRTFETFVRYNTPDALPLVPSLKNTAISIYEYENGTFTTVCFNRADHLSPEANNNPNPYEKELV